MALDGLERTVRKHFPKSKVNVVRFADDFVITGVTKELLETEVAPLVGQFLAERGLELSLAKTRITHIAEGFDFLGQNVRKYKGKLLTKPARKNVKAFLTKVRHIIRTSRSMTAGRLIAKLNPILRGWANYHRHIVSKKTFSKVGRDIDHAIWQWARRRHSGKTAKWLKKKYYKSWGRRNWVFYGEVEGKGGKTRTLELFNIPSVPIKRYTKIKGAANPYDPQWEMYFEQRVARKMVETFAGRELLLSLWLEQNGICPICKQKITKETGWNNHHIVKRVEGGSDKAENRVLLHPNCHRQVHSLKLEVTKPRPKGRLKGLSGVP